MAKRFVSTLIAILVFSLASTPFSTIGQKKTEKAEKAEKKTAQKTSKTPKTPSLTEEQRVLHLLDRTSFGPRPGDAEKVKAMGWEKYLDEQLHPERFADTQINEKLAQLGSVSLSNQQIATQYPQPQVLRDILKSKGVDVPDNQVQAVIYAPQMPAMQPQIGGVVPPQAAQQNPQMADPEIRAKRLEAQRVMRELGLKPQGQLVQELQQSKILRAVYSERQLQEVLTDFWFNHFNVFAQKGIDRILVTSYERDVIRPNVMGKFENLLMATAKSPAMLFYLDNWLSATPNQQQQRRMMPMGPQARRGRGINENYAREVMELHTLGVDGGYTQKDVQEVARCLTGWTIRDPRNGAEFMFNRNMHDDGEKIVLGTTIPAGKGIEDGEAVIRLLARHPSTARFVSTKLARKFVSDNPPKALVDRMVETFLKTDGDLREVMLAMFKSPEFWAPETYRAKIKTPFEMTVSAVRATGGDTNGGPQFHRWMAQMGEPLFMAQPPTGYSDVADTWVNTGALLERMNFSLALMANRIPGTRVTLAPISETETIKLEDLVDRYIKIYLRGNGSAQTRETIAKAVSGTQDMKPGTAEQARILGLIFGSPEFQRQ